MDKMLKLLLTTFVVGFMAGQASADRIGTLSKRLSSGSEKVRISAALSLAKSTDDRAVHALAKSLSTDRSAAIRRISAASLGQRLRSDVGRAARKQAMDALKRASKRDRDSKVKGAAKVALAKIDLGEAPTKTRAGRAKGVLVQVKAPKLSKRLPKNTAQMMQRAVKSAIRETSPSYVKTAPGTGMPSSSQLQKSGMAGFSVEPKLSKLKLVRSGRKVTVKCEIKMRVEPWAQKGANLAVNKSATVTGAGSVTSSSSRAAIAISSKACIQAVVAQVTSNQIVPFLARSR